MFVWPIDQFFSLKYLYRLKPLITPILLQSQKAVSAHFTSKQILPFGLCRAELYNNIRALVIGVWHSARPICFVSVMSVLRAARGIYMYSNGFLSLHPLCGGGDLLFLLSPPAAAATCFCSHSKYLQYAYWPWGICLVNFFAFFSFFNKIQDGRQNAMAHATAWTASSICFMFGLKERPYPGRELKSF